ncbi:MAG: hypothetical protein WBV93_20200, partial [Anaerobacillus sp.]
GEIAFEDLVEKARMELTKDKKVSLNEEDAIQSIRNVFLFCAGAAFEQHGEKLMDNQETLIKLANMAITLYAAESVVLRSLKQKDQADIKMKLTRTFLEESFLSVESSARMLLGSVLPKEERQQAYQLVFNEFSSYDFGNSLERNREIATHSYNKRKYDI